MISKYAYLALIDHVNTIKNYAYIMCIYIHIYYIYIYITLYCLNYNTNDMM